MKLKTKFTAIILSISFIAVMFPGSTYENVASESVEKITEEKIICNATIEDSFADDCVMVIMDKTVGGLNKKHDKSFFVGVEITNIVDLTEMSPNANVNMETFRQILKLELSVHSKENVLEAIKQLEKLRE